MSRYHDGRRTFDWELTRPVVRGATQPSAYSVSPLGKSLMVFAWVVAIAGGLYVVGTIMAGATRLLAETSVRIEMVRDSMKTGRFPSSVQP